MAKTKDQTDEKTTAAETPEQTAAKIRDLIKSEPEWTKADDDAVREGRKKRTNADQTLDALRIELGRKPMTEKIARRCQGLYSRYCRLKG